MSLPLQPLDPIPALTLLSLTHFLGEKKRKREEKEKDGRDVELFVAQGLAHWSQARNGDTVEIVQESGKPNFAGEDDLNDHIQFIMYSVATPSQGIFHGVTWTSK